MGNSAKSHIGWLVMLLVTMAWCSCASCHFETVSFMTFYIYICITYNFRGWGRGRFITLSQKSITFLLKLFKHGEGVSTAVDAFNYLSCK